MGSQNYCYQTPHPQTPHPWTPESGADGIILVFDICDRESFNHVDDWLNEAQSSPDCYMELDDKGLRFHPWIWFFGITFRLLTHGFIFKWIDRTRFADPLDTPKQLAIQPRLCICLAQVVYMFCPGFVNVYWVYRWCMLSNLMCLLNQCIWLIMFETTNNGLGGSIHRFKRFIIRIITGCKSDKQGNPKRTSK